MKLQSVIAGGFGAAALFLLASCGGSGGGIDPVAAQQLLGGDPPMETSSVQDDRAEEIIRRSDSLIVTALIVESEDGTGYFVADPYCVGSTCSFTLGGVPYGSIDLATLAERIGPDTRIPGSMILTRNGITIQYGYSNDANLLGSALNHSGFATDVLEISYQGSTFFGRGGIVTGDLSGSSPVVSGSWTGMMAGVHRRSNEFLLGDAAVSFTASGTGGSLSASFTNITNVSRSVAHSVAQASFSEVPVSSNGTFRSGSSGNRIQGGFFGHGHPEATGVFEHSGILGSFGTYRDQ